jgi:hypothetical protein
VVDLKLGPLPQQKMVKVAIVLSEPLKDELDAYTAEHNKLYEQAAETTELIPHILETFLRADRVWCRLWKQKGKGAALNGDLAQVAKHE